MTSRSPRRRHRTLAGVGAGPADVPPVAVVGVEAAPPPARVDRVLKPWSRARTLHLASQLGLVIMLVLALGASWRDGLPTDDAGLAVASDAPGFVSGRDIVPSAPVMVVGSALSPPMAPVPTARPVQLLIPALDVHRAVEAVGAGRSGVMNLPQNAWNAGWYNGSPVPGAPGDSVIEGHAGYPGQPMIFGRLAELRPGDRIIVMLADRSRQVFLVDSMSTIAVGTAPPGLAEPYGPPRLTLITCTGHFDKTHYSYSSRLVLEAHYAGPA